jgi:A/G-specific adenine glycosylase
MKKSIKSKFFTKNLLDWNSAHNARTMPWKGELNPYRIWLSEIILQQTRVEQGLEYYNRFIAQYPTVGLLAAAPENEVFKLWEGLGYYSRCRNLIASARYIAFELGGKFPESYEEILKLKGVGPYTAAAISSFAYNLPHAVVDGNVLRVLARFFGIELPADSNEGRKYFTELAQSLLNTASPALYNQAIMDFGATICKPQLPLCEICPLQKECTAFNSNTVNKLPVKEKKLKKRNRFFYYIIAEFKEKIYVRKRIEKDIWQSLFEFKLFEKEEKISVNELLTSAELKNFAGRKFKVINISDFYKQQLTHQSIEGVFIHIVLSAAPISNELTAIEKDKIATLAFPRFMTRFFEGRQSF